MNPIFSKQFYSSLGGFCLHLFNMTRDRHISDKKISNILNSNLTFKAFDSKKKRYVFIISNSPSNLNQDNIFSYRDLFYPSLDLIRNMRDELDRLAKKLAFPFRTFIDKGIIMNFGSDIPGNAGAIFFNDPKYVLNAAVNRTNNEGEPKGGWIPHLKISMEEAIECFTLNGAYACMREDNIRGTLKPGKLADILVVEGDPLKDISILCERRNILNLS